MHPHSHKCLKKAAAAAATVFTEFLLKFEWKVVPIVFFHLQSELFWLQWHIKSAKDYLARRRAL